MAPDSRHGNDRCRYADTRNSHPRAGRRAERLRGRHTLGRRRRAQQARPGLFPGGHAARGLYAAGNADLRGLRNRARSGPPQRSGLFQGNALTIAAQAVPGILYPASGTRHPASGTRHPAPYILYPVFCILYPASCTSHPTPGTRCRTHSFLRAVPNSIHPADLPQPSHVISGSNHHPAAELVRPRHDTAGQRLQITLKSQYLQVSASSHWRNGTEVS